MSRNDTILWISDLHIPFHHQDAFAFLEAIKKKYKPTRIISAGDEVDNHATSMHDSDPDLYSAGDELIVAKEYINELYSIFPKMDILESNHGSLYYRRAKKFGLPAFAMKTYNQLWEVGKGWKWHNDLTIRLPNKQQLYMCHGKNKNSMILSKNMGMNVIQGHYHGSFAVQYWGNPNDLNWAVNSGCLLDNKSLAFAYGKLVLDRPIIGTVVIKDSMPIMIPMRLTKKGRWDGEL